MHTLSDNERSVVVNALYTAVEKYRECAKEVAKEPGHERLVAQFKKQSDECAELIERLED